MEIRFGQLRIKERAVDAKMIGLKSGIVLGIIYALLIHVAKMQLTQSNELLSVFGVIELFFALVIGILSGLRISKILPGKENFRKGIKDSFKAGFLEGAICGIATISVAIIISLAIILMSPAGQLFGFFIVIFMVTWIIGGIFVGLIFGIVSSVASVLTYGATH